MGVLFKTLWTGKGGIWKELAWIGPSECIHPEPRRSVSKADKRLVMSRQNNKCNFCNIDITSGMYSNSDLDHIVCVSMGGLTVVENLNFLCVACHRRKTSLENRKDVRIIDMKPSHDQVYIVYNSSPKQEGPLNAITPLDLHESSDQVLILDYNTRMEGVYIDPHRDINDLFERFRYVPT